MMNKYDRIEKFIAELINLNPKGQFKIADASTIAIKYTAPQYLKLPSGYSYNSHSKTITGRSNFVVIWE